MAATIWLAGSIAALGGWVGLEAAVELWIGAHRVTIVALAAVIVVPLIILFALLGLPQSPSERSAARPLDRPA
jgi:hypothetical protein